MTLWGSRHEGIIKGMGSQCCLKIEISDGASSSLTI